MFCEGVPAAGSSNVLRRRNCLPSHNYTVFPNDTPQTIAESFSVSTDDIIALNCLDSNGDNLQANSSILLPGCCNVYLVKQNDTCDSIANSTLGLTLPDFFSFNPMIKNDCSNLLSGTNVCLNAPLGTPFNAPSCSAQSNASTTIAGALPSIASGTSPTCGPLHTVKTGEDCIGIAKASNITRSHFLAINPSIEENCSNLIAGQEYCVSPP